MWCVMHESVRSPTLTYQVSLASGRKASINYESKMSSVGYHIHIIWCSTYTGCWHSRDLSCLVIPPGDQGGEGTALTIGRF